MDQQLASDLYEPNPRFQHVASSVCDGPGQLIVWGGETSEFYSNDGRIQLASVVEQFDIHSEVWCQRGTGGTPHPGLSDTAYTSFGNRLFMYGGYCDDMFSSFSGALSCLDLTTLTWSQLSLAGGTAWGPMRKIACGVVHFHHDKLAVIGGYGILTGPTQPGSSFIGNTKFTDGRGWMNEIHVFDISQGVWFSPTLRGTRPPPCAHFTLTNIDNHRAVLFGGLQPGCGGVVNDLYLIDFNTMEFTKVEPHEGEPWPVGRDGHTACCLGYAGDHIHLLVTGGRGRDDKALRDIWLFDLSLKKWKEVTLPDSTLPRINHSTTAITLCPGLVEVIVFGGTTEDWDVGKPAISYSRIAETTIITFGQIGSEWMLVGVANNSQRGTSERVREKMLLKSGTDTQEPQIKFDLESQLTPYGLHRLERGGVQVRREINTKNKDFQAVLRLKQPDANLAMIKWTNSVQQTNIKPTWKNLFLILRLINLDHLAEEINMYLSGAAVKQQLSGGTSSSIEQDPGSKGITESLSEVFTLASLTQLEKREGIPVLTEMEAKNHEFQAIIRVKQSDVSWAINKWLTAPVLSRIKPTWKNLLSVLRLINLDHLAEDIETYSKKHSLSSLKEDKGGDIEKLRDDMLDLCDKLKEGDVDENVRYLRYKIEILSKSAIEQIKEKTETIDMLLADLKTLQPSSILPQLGTAEETMLMVKTEPASPSVEELDTSTQEPVLAAAMTTQSLVKKEPLEEDVMSTAIYPTADADVSTEHDMLRMENQQLRSQLTSVQSPEGIMETKPTSSQLTGFRGAEVCGETSIVVTNNPQSFIWEGFGLKLHIPKGCLPVDMEQCIISVQASLAGQYEFPENSHLVSAVFWLRCEPRCKFTEALTLELDHCAKLENIDPQKLHFVRALCSQKHLPYAFEKLGGNFNSSGGAIELNSFSGVAITQEGSEEREYCAMLFYLIIQHQLLIHFVVTWNTKTHLKVVKKEYGRKQALPGHTQSVEFESDKITLSIPMEGTSSAGWTISPLFPPVVIKKNVDNFKPGKMIPSCQLSAEFLSSSKEKVPSLKHHVKLLGAKEPYDSFLIKPPAATLTSVAEAAQGRGVALKRESDSSGIITDFAGPSPEKKLRIERHHQTSDDGSIEVHHAPYLHGNQAPPPPTQQAARHPWQPTMHHATDRDGLQSLTSAATPSTMLQQGYLIPPPSQPGGLQVLPNLSQGTQPSAQHTYYISNPVVHHAPYIHGNQAPPPHTQLAAHHPWQPTMHQATDRDRLQTSTSAVTPSTMLQQDGGDVISHKNITIEDVVNQAGISLDALSEECSRTVLLHLAKYCVQWKLTGQHLGLTSTEISDVDGDNKTAQEKKVGMLMKWKEKSLTTSYRVFIESLLSQGRTQDAIEACKVIGAASRH